MAWVKNNVSSPAKSGILHKKQGSTYAWDMLINNNTWFDVYFRSGGTPTNVLNDRGMTSGYDQWHQLVFTYNASASEVKGYRDGVLVSTSSYSSVLDDASAKPFTIGQTGSGELWAGQLDDIRVYDQPLTAADILTIYNNTSNNASFFQWGAEESLANLNFISFADLSGNGKTATSATISLTPGVIGQGTVYNGKYTSVVSPSLGSGLKTVAFWVRFATTTKSEELVNFDGTAHIETDSSGNVVCTSCGAATVYVDSSSGSANIPRADEWHHVVVTVAGGVTGSTFELGHGPTGSVYLGGSLDDVRVYNRVLSQEEITRLYGPGATTRVGVSMSGAPNQAGNVVAWWSMDGSKVDLSQYTAELRDSSGNGRHMDWRNHASTTVPGAIGQAISFDGIDDYATTTVSLGTVKSVSFWVNFATTTHSEEIIHIGATTRIETDSGGTVACTNCGTATIYVDGSSASATIVRAGEWHHVVATVAGGVSASNFELGRFVGGGSQYLGGSLDDVRVYSSVLSATEIRHLYETGK